MKIQVSAQTKEKVHQLAKVVHSMMIPCYTFNGSRLKRAPEIQLRDTIVERMIDPTDLLRVQLRYPEDGPDDRWYAACEALLGGGIDHEGKCYRILGGSSSVKKGCFWLATDTVRNRIHPFFNTSQEALSYLGIMFSGCHHGIHQLDNIKGRVVEDGKFDTADGQGYISSKLLKSLSLPDRQLQVRFVSDNIKQRWLGKGTLLPCELPDGLDFILPKSMIKGKGCPPSDRSWSCWFGIRDLAKTRDYSSSFTFAQWFDKGTIDAVWPVVERKLKVIKNALTDRSHALSFLGLIQAGSDTTDVRTKAEAFLRAGVGPDHPWLHRQLVQLIRKEYVRLATGGGFELQGRMGAYADLPDDTICIADLPAGPIVLSRYPIRDPQSVIAVWNEPDSVIDALSGTVYMNVATAELLDGDFDGDYYITCKQEAVVEAVTSNAWHPKYQRQDVPPKRRLKDPLAALPFAAVRAVGNRIGTITYAISGAVHAGKLDKVAQLSSGLQAEVQSLKWDTQADRELLNDRDLQIPEYISNTKKDKKLFVHQVEIADGEFPLIQNHNQVVKRWLADTLTVTPLVHFKPLIPIWLEPSSLDLVEEAHAVVQTYNRWIASILQQNAEPNEDDLKGPILFLESWDRSKLDNRRAWATALWHVTHSSRAATTGSAAFHAFSQEMVDMMIEQQDCEFNIQVPVNKNSLTNDLINGAIIPLIGGKSAAEEQGIVFTVKLHSIPTSVRIHTRINGNSNTGFWYDNIYIGQLPKDHLLYGSIPAGLNLEARLQLRGRTVYMSPVMNNWIK